MKWIFYLKISFLLLFTPSLSKLYAQESINSAEGIASGIGGNTTYSIGQVAYTPAVGIGGTVAPGVQQNYAINVITGIDDDVNWIGLSIYPNPVSNVLNLEFNGNKYPNLSYQVIDLLGRIVKKNSIENDLTVIDVAPFAPETYFIIFSQGKQTIKYFKFVKK